MGQCHGQLDVNVYRDKLNKVLFDFSGDEFVNYGQFEEHIF